MKALISDVSTLFSKANIVSAGEDVLFLHEMATKRTNRIKKIGVFFIDVEKTKSMTLR